MPTKIKYFAKILPSVEATDHEVSLLLHDHTHLRIFRVINPSLGKEPSLGDSIDLQPTWGPGNRVFYTYQVPSGQVNELQWLGGGQMLLDAGTRLQFTDRDSNGTRSYFLIGRAIFTPATADTNATEIRIPGEVVVTSRGQKVFIDDFQNRQKMVIAAYQQGVEIRNNNWHQKLSERHGAFVYPDGQFKLSIKQDTPLGKDWSKDLRIHDLSLPEALQEVDLWYDNKVSIEGIDSGFRMTGVLSRKASLDFNLAILSGFYHVKLSASNQKESPGPDSSSASNPKKYKNRSNPG